LHKFFLKQGEKKTKMFLHTTCAFYQVTLEAEVTNKGALALYGRMGFIRAKRLYRYYLNGVDAFRLKLLFPHPDPGLPPMMIGSDRDDEQMDSPYL
jgi:N-alpha-acetyltransferase 30